MSIFENSIDGSRLVMEKTGAQRGRGQIFLARLRRFDMIIVRGVPDPAQYLKHQPRRVEGGGRGAAAL